MQVDRGIAQPHRECWKQARALAGGLPRECATPRVNKSQRRKWCKRRPKVLDLYQVENRRSKDDVTVKLFNIVELG